MRGLTHRWIGPTPAASESPGDGPDAGLERVVERVLAARGFADAHAAASFIEPKLTGLSAPSALADLDRSAERLLAAVRAGEVIAIYGDYDVDGICATTILFRTLEMIDPSAPAAGRVLTRVPDRLTEGYGLNRGALEELADAGARIVVTVDCGVTAHAEAGVARELGIDLIITDHHELDSDGLPGSWATIHPRRPGNDVAAAGAADLCGAGVAFKLAWRVLTMHAGRDRLDEPARELLLDLLALTGLATVADVVPLVEENRTLARFGLARVKATSLVGLRALLDACDLSGQRIDSEAAGFALGPRLNACGRLGHARDAVELLTTSDAAHAEQIAARLDELNRERQSVERRIADQATRMATERGLDRDGVWSIVLADDGWHPGVVGIVCSRLVGRLGRPTILLCRDGELLKGSARSVDGFDLHGALARCANHLETFGGHEMAAGLALRAERLERFAEAFERVAAEQLTAEMLTPSLTIDCEAALDELTVQAVEQLDRLGPFGRMNPSPTLLVRGARLIEPAATMGAHGRHMSLRVRHGQRQTRMVAWSWGERADLFRAGTTVDLVVRPKINEWNGRRSVEPEIRDARVVH